MITESKADSKGEYSKGCTRFGILELLITEGEVGKEKLFFLLLAASPLKEERRFFLEAVALPPNSHQVREPLACPECIARLKSKPCCGLLRRFCRGGRDLGRFAKGLQDNTITLGESNQRRDLLIGGIRIQIEV